MGGGKEGAVFVGGLEGGGGHGRLEDRLLALLAGFLVEGDGLAGRVRERGMWMWMRKAFSRERGLSWMEQNSFAESDRWFVIYGGAKE